MSDILGSAVHCPLSISKLCAIKSSRRRHWVVQFVHNTNNMIRLPGAKIQYCDQHHRNLPKKTTLGPKLFHTSQSQPSSNASSHSGA